MQTYKSHFKELMCSVPPEPEKILDLVMTIFAHTSRLIERILLLGNDTTSIQKILKHCDDHELFNIGIQNKQLWLEIRKMIKKNVILHPYPLHKHQQFINKCTTLDVYVHHGGQAVAQFFSVTSEFRVTFQKENTTYGTTSKEDMDGDTVIIMQKGEDDSFLIRIRCCSDNACATIFKQKTSNLFNWIGYKELTLRELAILSHVNNPLENADDIKQVVKVGHLNASHGSRLLGFHSTAKLSTERAVPSKLEKITCPAVIRTTLDPHAFRALFGVKVPKYGVVWCLGAMECDHGVDCSQPFVKTFKLKNPRNKDMIYMTRVMCNLDTFIEL
ncbi:hypothetical protein R3P38DRAFT_2797873 [Favolaschia claudopus]|uniref:Uncharacterized protein n=1 Tax=Favolaschia claudopus TaxID=2862362 RepID=A0AAW0A3H2_9AGAR